MGFAVPGRPPQTQFSLSSKSLEAAPPTTTPITGPGDSGWSSSQASDTSSKQGTSVGSCQLPAAASAHDGLQQDSGHDGQQPWQQQTNLKLVTNERAVQTSASDSPSYITAGSEENTVSSFTDMDSLEDCLLPAVPCPAKPLLQPSTLR